jgi:hypothetical protein
MVEGKKFKDLKRNRILTVNTVNENNIAIFDNGEKAAVERILDPRFFEEISGGRTSVGSQSRINETKSHVDVNSNVFSNNENYSNSRYEKMLKGSHISIGEEEQSILRQTDGGNRWNMNSAVKTSDSVIETHNDNLRSLGKEIKEPVVKSYQQSNKSQEQQLLEKYGNLYEDKKQPINNNNTQTSKNVSGKTLAELEAEMNGEVINNNQQPVQQPVKKEPENPMKAVYDKAKKTYKLNVSLDIDEKIPSKEVINMLEENFDGSAIDYYAKDIYQKLMDNPSILEDQIKEAIKKYVEE